MSSTLIWCRRLRQETLLHRARGEGKGREGNRREGKGGEGKGKEGGRGRRKERRLPVLNACFLSFTTERKHEQQLDFNSLPPLYVYSSMAVFDMVPLRRYLKKAEQVAHP